MNFSVSFIVICLVGAALIEAEALCSAGAKMSGPARLLTPQPARSYAQRGLARNSIPYAQAALPAGKFAQAIVNVALVIVGALLICAAAVAVASPVLIGVLFIFS